MKVYVRLAEPFWRVLGLREIEMSLGPGSRVADLLSELRRQYPGLGAEFEQTSPHVFLGEAEVTGDALLMDGAHIHLVWPIAGG